MAKSSTKQSTKELLLAAGIEIMSEKGYNNTGISEVLEACAVPKGSFYHYFKSKEDFALQVITAYEEGYSKSFASAFSDKSAGPLTKINRYIEANIEQSKKRKCACGCLLLNLSQEMADQNEVLRLRLKELLGKRRSQLEKLIKQAKDQGEISSSINPADSAEFFMCALEGALTHAKLCKNTKPLLLFKQYAFSLLFGAPETSGKKR